MKKKYKPKDGCRTIWLKVSHDRYELPVAVADTSAELAKLCGVTSNTIQSSMSKWKSGVNAWSPYRKIRVEIDD